MDAARSFNFSIDALPVGVALNLACPGHKSEKLPLIAPEKIPEVARLNVARRLACVGFQPPAQILASPGRQSVPARRVPQKSDRLEQSGLLFLEQEYRIAEGGRIPYCGFT
jgi:hypothetical protein